MLREIVNNSMRRSDVQKQGAVKLKNPLQRQWGLSSIILAILIFLLTTWSVNADQLEEAESAIAIKNYARANQILGELDEAGDSTATYYLGLSYLEGRGLDVDESYGLELIRKSADAGNPHAQYHLSTLYEFGNYVDQDSDLAWKWAEKAAYQNHGIAQLSLGTFCWLRGTQSDRIEALMWIELALSSIPLEDPRRGFAEVASDQFRSMMTSDQIAEAEKAAKAWKDRAQ